MWRPPRKAGVAERIQIEVLKLQGFDPALSSQEACGFFDGGSMLLAKARLLNMAALGWGGKKPTRERPVTAELCGNIVGSYRPKIEPSQIKLRRNGIQFSDGITALSITTSSTGALIGSSFNPNC
jgi:hypothetical protein